MPNRPRTIAALLIFGATLPGYAGSDTLFSACYGCHGPGGVSQATHMPTISGLNFQYFYATMQAFKKDRRNSTVMGRIAKGYKTSQLQRMALYFGGQPWTGRPGDFDPELAQSGRTLHQDHCEECHKQDGYFQDRETPPLAGQARGYLLYQMRDYRVAASAMPQPPLMQERLEKLSDEELLALAEFYASSLPKKAGAE
jgi:sulfide dehydrogenase cytochrome subunit